MTKRIPGLETNVTGLTRIGRRSCRSMERMQTNAQTASRTKAVVCLSGGMDSAVCAALAARDYEAYALHISYGQRTENRELQSAREVAETRVSADFCLSRSEYFGKSAVLHSPTPPLRCQMRLQAKIIGVSVPVTYVPFRNAHFLSAAVSWAEVIGAKRIFIGAVEQDSSGYPDCRPQYYEAFQRLIQTGTRDGDIEVVNSAHPLEEERDRAPGLELNAPLHLTWSCYSGEDERRAAVCESCVLRLRAFGKQECGIPFGTPRHFDI